MIDLNQKQKIISAHLGGVSNREITRQMHMSKDTVNKYVREYDEKRAEFLSMDQTWNSRRSPRYLKQLVPEYSCYLRGGMHTVCYGFPKEE